MQTVVSDNVRSGFMLGVHALRVKIVESSVSKDLQNKRQLLSVLDHSLNHT